MIAGHPEEPCAALWPYAREDGKRWIKKGPAALRALLVFGPANWPRLARSDSRRGYDDKKRQKLTMGMDGAGRKMSRIDAEVTFRSM